MSSKLGGAAAGGGGSTAGADGSPGEPDSGGDKSAGDDDGGNEGEGAGERPALGFRPPLGIHPPERGCCFGMWRAGSKGTPLLESVPGAIGEADAGGAVIWSIVSDMVILNGQE